MKSQSYYNKNKRITDLFILFCIIGLIGCLMIILRTNKTSKLKHIYLIWNLFLAFIPLVISIVLQYVNNKNEIAMIKKFISTILIIIWFFFYPNSLYMLTDYIHIATVKYFSKVGYNTKLNNDVLIWFDFIILNIFIWDGVFGGLVSLEIMEDLIRKKTHKFIGDIFVFVVILASGFGIYLGRFIRWNTWDILARPYDLINSAINNININSLAFTLLFSLFYLMVYIVYRHIRNSNYM